MQLGKINQLITSKDAPAFAWHHTKYTYLAGSGKVTVTVKLPKTMHVDGMPVDYVVSVTPDQPCAVSVTNKTRHSFDVTLTSLTGGALAEGSMMLLVMG